MRKHGLHCRLVSVCPSVRNVHLLYPDGWRYRQLLFQPGSPITLVFLTPHTVPNSKGNSLSAGTEYVGGLCSLRSKPVTFWEKFAIFDWNRHLSRKWYGIVAMERQWEMIGGRSIHVSSNDLKWPWKAEHEGSNFPHKISFINNARSLRPRMTKFGRIPHGEEGHIFRDQPRPHCKGARPRSSPILGVPFYLCIHPLTQNYQIWGGNIYACF